MTNNLIGGSGKYLSDIIKKYIDCNFLFIKNSEQLKKIKFESKDILFLQTLFSTNISVADIINLKHINIFKLVISIHDFYWLTDKIKYEFYNGVHNHYLDNDIQINNDIKILFSLAADIIHPSLFTYNLFSKYIQTNNHKIIYHNDFMINNENKFIPEIINKTINIGVLHELSECKGRDYILYLKKHVVNYKNFNIQWFIVGVNIKKYDELEFFDYLSKYNIHCLTYLNKWGETWCYTLTKGINSGLPIIYNNFGAFKERIIEKEHYFKVCENENEFNNNYDKLLVMFKKMIDYVIDNNGTFKKMDIDKEILYNEYYNSLFDKNDNDDIITIEKKNIVLITSKIYVSNNPFSYTKKRSVYTKDERFLQTIKTIDSIKKYIEDVYIILFDNSIFEESERQILSNNVDLFINITNDETLNYYTNEYEYKSISEIYQIITFFNLFKQKYIFPNLENFFKISGRYELVENPKNIIDIDNNVFKLNQSVIDRKYYYTSFYKIYKTKINNYVNALNFIFDNKNKYEKMDLEVSLPIVLNYDFSEISHLGIKQYIAAWAQIDII